jgi:hypothetical protein
MKKAMLYVSLVLMVILGGILVGCHVFGPEPVIEVDQIADAGNDGNYSRRTDLALIKTQETHQIGISELSQIALNAFNQTMVSQTTERSIVTTSKITGTKSVPTNTRNVFERSGRFDGGEGRRRSVVSDEPEAVEVLEFAIGDGTGDEWFILASNDVRVGHILAITQESFADSDTELATFLRESLNEYIEAVVLEYNDITDDEAEATLNAIHEAEMLGVARVVDPGITLNPYDWELTGYTSNLNIQKYPLLQSEWGQGSSGYTATGYAYNNYIKHYYRSKTDGQFYVTGCATTAMAQIIAYHNYINPNMASMERMAPSFTDATSSTMNMGTWNGRNGLNGYQRQYNLSLIRNMRTITNSSTAAAKGQIAALMYHIFQETYSAPRGPDDTWTETKYISPAFKNFGYNIAYEGAATSLSGTSNSFSLQYHTGLATIRSAIDNEQPIFVKGMDTTGIYGHFWVIDGYGAVTWIEENYRHRISELTTTRRITLNNVLMVHCNMGWNGNNYGYSGWYMYGIFDTAANRNHLNMPNIKAGDENYSTGTWLVIPRKP